MKLYAIILFVVVLNFSFGFVGTMLPWFLPDAAEELQNNFKMDNDMIDSLNKFEKDAANLDNNWLSAALTMGLDILKSLFTFIVSCITFLPDLIENVLNQIYSGTDDSQGALTAIDILCSILRWGLGVLLGISVIQLFTGKWLPFAE